MTLPRAPFFRQRERLALRLDEVIRGFLSDAGVPDVNGCLQTVHGQFSVGRFPDTREMRFFLADLGCFTAELTNRLHRLVRDEFPRWTVVAQFDEHTFAVTVAGLTFPDKMLPGPLGDDAPESRDWLASAGRYDAGRYGPIRRQVAAVVPRVPGGLIRLAAESAVVLGAFDRWPPPFPGVPVWVLVPGHARHWRYNEPDIGGDEHAVTADGRVHAQYDDRFNPLTGEQPAAWLVGVRFDAPVGPTLTVLNDRGEVVTRVPVPPVEAV